LIEIDLLVTRCVFKL